MRPHNKGSRSTCPVGALALHRLAQLQDLHSTHAAVEAVHGQLTFAV